MDAVMRLLSAFRLRPNFSGQHFFLESTLVSRARNAYATAVLNNPKITHLLFIDSDMGFQPSAVMRLFDFDKPFVGCICPYRSMDYERFHAISREIDDPALAQKVAQNYVTADRLIRNPDGRIERVAGFARTERLGMGVTLLRRDALERMVEVYPDMWGTADLGYQSMGIRGRVFQPFEPYRTNDGLYLSEDMAFSRRWTEAGGEIWALLDEPITHVGPTAFTGTYSSRLDFEAG